MNTCKGAGHAAEQTEEGLEHSFFNGTPELDQHTPLTLQVMGETMVTSTSVTKMPGVHSYGYGRFTHPFMRDYPTG